MKLNEIITEGLWSGARDMASKAMYNLTGNKLGRGYDLKVKDAFINQFQRSIEMNLKSAQTSGVGADIPGLVDAYLAKNGWSYKGDPNEQKYTQAISSLSNSINAGNRKALNQLSNLVYQIASMKRYSGNPTSQAGAAGAHSGPVVIYGGQQFAPGDPLYAQVAQAALNAARNPVPESKKPVKPWVKGE
jgi:hypothetical protein